MPPLAGDAVGAIDQVPVEGDAATAAGADDDGEHAFRALRRAVERFGQGQAFGVVGQADGLALGGLQILAETAAIEIGRVGVAHHAGARRHRSGRADADGHVAQRLDRAAGLPSSARPIRSLTSRTAAS